MTIELLISIVMCSVAIVLVVFGMTEMGKDIEEIKKKRQEARWK